MKLAMDFLKPITPLLRVGFRAAAEERNMSAFNVALSYNKKHAIGREAAYFDDNAFLLLHFPGQGEWYVRTSGITRGMGEYVFAVEDSFLGQETHVYLMFTSTVEDEVSDSRYIHVPALV